MNFRNFLNKISYYLKDIYGVDKLSKYLIIAGLILSLTRFTYYIGLALSLYGFWRSLSKNKHKRYKELVAFEKMLSKFIQKFYSYKSSMEQNKHYKILRCPNCSQKLRIPRKQGKVSVTCKKCGHGFKSKS